jgi:hypothetical protein
MARLIKRMEEGMIVVRVFAQPARDRVFADGTVCMNGVSVKWVCSDQGGDTEVALNSGTEFIGSGISMAKLIKGVEVKCT